VPQRSATPRMSATWHVVFGLLSLLCLAAAGTVPGCTCPLSTCCQPAPPDSILSGAGPLERHEQAPPAVCELLGLSSDASTVCNGMGTVCDAVLPGLNEKFNATDAQGMTSLGRFIGQGTCAELPTKCALPEQVRMDFWRRDVFDWPDLGSTEIDFNLPGYPKLSVAESCEHDEVALRLQATWRHWEGHSHVFALDLAIPEGEWQKAGEDDILEYVCQDFKGPDGVAPLYVLYLKIGEYPCKNQCRRSLFGLCLPF